jgi:hypothetical protein
MPEKTQPDVDVAASSLPSGVDYAGEMGVRPAKDQVGGRQKTANRNE